MRSSASATLGMVFYELATNAAKYGALSTLQGRIYVSWRLDAATGRLYLDWVEQGPPVAGRMKEGFGTTFVERSVGYELRGNATLELQPAGLSCRLDFPLRRNVQSTSTNESEGLTHDERSE